MERKYTDEERKERSRIASARYKAEHREELNRKKREKYANLPQEEKDRLSRKSVEGIHRRKAENPDKYRAQRAKSSRKEYAKSRQDPKKVEAMSIKSKKYYDEHIEKCKAYHREYRERNRVEIAERNRRLKTAERRGASNAVALAIREGRLIRAAVCEECNIEGFTEGHHHKGYAEEFWLDVVWLCLSCHGKRRWDGKRLIDKLLS